MEIDLGRVVAGKYELVRLLGRGSMGEVWAAHHKTLSEKLALKLLTPNPSQEEELEDATTANARFRFEAQVAARLSRKTRHIVRVTDHGEEDGLAYLAMELLEGETLEDVLVRDKRVPLATVTKVVTQVARALACAHEEGVFHRDLKPANVFLTRDEESKLLVKLLDFGIARAIHAHRAPSGFSTAKGLVFGTPSYMSPEQARASRNLDHRCDLWALSTIAYEALSGELPVSGAETDELLANLCAGRIVPLRQRSPDMPAALDAFFRRAFSEAVGARFQSASELAQAFARAAAAGSERHAATDPPGAGPPPTEAPVETEIALPVQRGKRVLIATGLSLVALAAVAVTWRALSPAPPAQAMVPVTPKAAETASIAPPATTLAPPSSTLVGQPAVSFSSLPRSTARPPLVAAPPSAPALSARPTPAPVPVQSSTPPPKKPDKSEVL
jgi:eukaryotic-like serine/threonine-protein kinase